VTDDDEDTPIRPVISTGGGGEVIDLVGDSGDEGTKRPQNPPQRSTRKRRQPNYFNHESSRAPKRNK